MRVKRVREGIHEAFEHVVVVHLVETLEKSPVAFAESFLDLFPGLLFEREVTVADHERVPAPR